MNAVGPERDHRLDCDDHAGLELHTATLLAVVRHIGILVHGAADTVTNVVAQHTVAIGLSEGLHRVADITDMVTGNGLLDGSLQAVERALTQTLDLNGGGADVKRPGIIPHPTIHDGAGVDGNHVAVAQNDVGVGDAVHDGIVQGCTDGAREAAVTLEGRGSTMHADDLLGELVELEGGHAGTNHRPDVTERHLRQRSGLLHLLNFGGRLELDHRPSSAFTSVYTRSMSRLPSTTLRMP